MLLLMLVGCQQTIELSDIAANPEEYLGKTITVTATTALDNKVICTLMECPEEDPCCNSCAGSLYLVSENLNIKLLYDEQKCSGDNCGLICSPLRHNKEYTITGKLTEEYSEYIIGVESWNEE